MCEINEFDDVSVKYNKADYYNVFRYSLNIISLYDNFNEYRITFKNRIQIK